MSAPVFENDWLSENLLRKEVSRRAISAWSVGRCQTFSWLTAGSVAARELRVKSTEIHRAEVRLPGCLSYGTTTKIR
jgi:hypothetical protein